MSQYDDPMAGQHAHAHVTPTGRTEHTEVNVDTQVTRAIDRVRWGPILAGLFAALSALALLGVLGMAVGLTAYDPGDPGRNFGIGAGIWGAISALLAFFIGGWLAARSAAVRGHHNGLLNGAMVWAVAIPLLIYLIAGGVTAIANTATNAAGVAANAASSSQQAGNAVDRVVAMSVNDPRANAAAQQQDPAAQQRTRDEALRTARRSAWGTLVSLCLGLAAAAAGGWVGARERTGDVTVRETTA